MHRITRRSVLVLVVIGALVAGGAAYTSTISGAGTSNNTAGYKDVTVSGASLTDAKYGLSADGSLIDTVTFTFANNLTNDRLQYIVDTAPAPGGGTGTALEDCAGDSNVTSGGIIGSGAVSGGVTTVTCTLATPAATETASDLNVVVTNN
jgi:hypothetical protein